MKFCPKCKKTYSDESLNFCLADGMSLSTMIDEETVVISGSEPPKRKGGIGIWFVLGTVAMFVGILIGSSAVYFIAVRGLDGDRTDKANTPAGSSTPKPTQTQATVSSPTPSQSPAGSPTPPPKPINIDEVTPIAWTTMGMEFKGETGQTYKFECPPNGKPSGVYGHDIYAPYSSICTAAVHAGLITLESGGTITLEYRPGRPLYGSTERNGIKSNIARESDRSFVVR